MDWLQLLGAILGSSLITSLVNNWFARRKVAADAATLLANQAMTAAGQTINWKDAAIKELQEKVVILEKTLSEQQGVIDELFDENGKLRNKLVEFEARLNGVEESGEIFLTNKDGKEK